MQSITLLDASFAKLGELTQYACLRVTRSYCGVGAFELTTHPAANGALLIEPDGLLFSSADPETMLLCEEISLTRDKLTVKGTTLKGLARRRVCVPPLSLPARLWRYASGAWTEVTDASTIHAALTDTDVLQGFEKPATAVEGTYFLDMKELSTVYDWGAGLGDGQIVSDLGTAQIRSRYQNFGWDRFTGSAESAYLHYVNNNLIAPEDAARAIPLLTAANDQHRGDTLPWQARFERLDTLLERIGETTGLGWNIVPDYQAKRWVFKAWEGRDLSQGTTVAVISEKMGNASAVTRRHSLTGSATTAYVGGAGEEENRLILSVGAEATGLARRELWTEAGSLTDAELLRLYARDKLDASAATHTLTAELIDSGACRYRRDYDVGDRVQITGAFGSVATRIAAVTETYEDGRRTLEATFGDAPVTLSRAFTRLQSAAQ